MTFERTSSTRNQSGMKSLQIGSDSHEFEEGYRPRGKNRKGKKRAPPKTLGHIAILREY